MNKIEVSQGRGLCPHSIGILDYHRPLAILTLQIIQIREIMNRPFAILMIFLIILGLGFSTYALFQGKFVAALSVYPLLIIAYVFLRLGKR